MDKARVQWEKTLWHLSHQRFACEPDARAALASQLKTCPDWLVAQAAVQAVPQHRRPGRPRKDAAPDHTEWQIQATVSVDAAAVTRQARRNASFLVATNVLDPTQISDHELVQTYTEQHSVENRLHWPRDVTLGEDACQVRSGHAPQVLAALRNAVVGLLHLSHRPNLAAALRTTAWSPPAVVLGLLGLTPSQTLNDPV